jgi:adhesin/invasin
MHSAGFFDGDGIIRRHRYFEFQVNNTQTISGLFSTIAGQNISVDWGDGSARSTYSGTNQVWSKDYGSAGDRTVRIFGSVVLTTFVMDAGGADISFDIANAPTGLTYLNVGGSNTVSGDIANAPTGLTYLSMWGSNTVSGDIANVPTGLTVLSVGGSNTVSGDIANAPTGLTYLNVGGSNTVSGDIANAPTGLTYLDVRGSNTVSGDIANAPTGLTSLSMGGSNTIADYTGKTWTTKPTSFYLIPVGAGGLSTAEVDQLLIDFDDDLVWAAGNVITLTGANAARSAASDAAVASMVAEGATVTTN